MISRKTLIIALLSTQINAHSAVFHWPDTSAPCNTTLNACVDAISNGDSIFLQTNNVINENISTTKDISLIADNGYKPIFGDGNTIHIMIDTPRANRSIRIQGLTLIKGEIRISGSAGGYKAYIENNTIYNTFEGIPAIEINSQGTDPIEMYINYNLISAVGPTVGTYPYGVILVNKHGTGVANFIGEIYNNTIIADAAEFGKGISLYVQNDSSLNFNITANEVYGAKKGGIFAARFASSNSGISELDIVSNVMAEQTYFNAIVKRGIIPNASGIHVVNDSGVSNADIINNTMVNNDKGVQLLNGSAGTFNANVYNNLIYNCQAGFDYDASVNATNDYNLDWGNSFNTNFSPGLNRILQDPKLIGSNNLRLREDSPAIDAGDALALLFVADAAFVDADGTYRLKKHPTSLVTGDNIDIGAYEAGNRNILFTNKASGFYIASQINHVELNGLPDLDSLHVTANFNPLFNGGLFNMANEAIYYDGSKWRLFNEGKSTPIELNSAFNISKYASTSTTFRHVSSDSVENNTMLNQSGLNGHPEYILQVSQNWDNIYNPHPPGIFYFGNNWFIINNDLIAMPSGSRFNIYYQQRSKSAYQHVVSSANNLGTATELDNNLINGISCAQIQVTQSGSLGVFNPSPVGVSFNQTTGKWSIFNQTLSSIQNGAAFHVIIDSAQIAQCTDSIFQNRFE